MQAVDAIDALSHRLHHAASGEVEKGVGDIKGRDLEALSAQLALQLGDSSPLAVVFSDKPGGR